MQGPDDGSFPVTGEEISIIDKTRYPMQVDDIMLGELFQHGLSAGRAVVGAAGAEYKVAAVGFRVVGKQLDVVNQATVAAAPSVPNMPRSSLSRLMISTSCPASMRTTTVWDPM